jgi:DNA gyrase/topoisomerase IV subunit B
MKKHIRVGDKYCSLGMAALTAVSSEMVANIVERERSCTIDLACGRLRAPTSIISRPSAQSDSTRLSFALDPNILQGNTRFDPVRVRAACREVQTDFAALQIEVRGAEVSDADR